MKLPVETIKLNPDNPRIIKDEKFRKLVESVKEFPEMTEIREVVVNKDYMILGGNMRFKAMQEAGFKEIPVKVVDLTPEQQRAFVIKDNVSGGEWDWESLLQQFSEFELEEWGLDLPEFKTNFDDDYGVEDEGGEYKNEVTIKIIKDDYEQIENELREILQKVKYQMML